MLLLNIQYAAVQGLFWASYCAILGMPLVYFTAKGFSYTQAGMITAACCLFTGIVQPLYQESLARNRRLTIRTALCAIYVISALISASIYLIPDGNFLCFLAIFSLISALQLSTASTLNSFAMEYFNKGLNINFGLGRGIGSLMYGLMGLVLGEGISVFGVDLLPAVNVLVLLLLVVVVFSMKAPERYRGRSVSDIVMSSEEPAEQIDNVRIPAFLRAHPLFTLFVIGSFFVFTGNPVTNSSYASEMVAKFGGDVAEAGRLILVMAGSEMLPMMCFKYVNRFFSVNRILVFSFVCIALKAVSIYFAPSMGFLYAAQIFQGLGYGIYAVSYVYFVNQLIEPSNRILAQGLVWTVMEIGCTVSYFLSGFILDQKGYSYLLLLAIGLMFLGGLIMSVSTMKAEKITEK